MMQSIGPSGRYGMGRGGQPVARVPNMMGMNTPMPIIENQNPIGVGSREDLGGPVNPAYSSGIAPSYMAPQENNWGYQPPQKQMPDMLRPGMQSGMQQPMQRPSSFLQNWMKPNQMQPNVQSTGAPVGQNNIAPQGKTGFLNKFKPPGMPSMKPQTGNFGPPGLKNTGLGKTLNKGIGGFNPVKSIFSKLF